MLVTAIISLIDSIPYSIRTIYQYSGAMLGVTPRGDAQMTSKLTARLTDNPPVPVERVALCRAMGTQVQSIVGRWPFVVLALSPEDTRYYFKRQGVRGIQGRLPNPGQPEAVISRPVAKNKRLHIGSVLLGPNLDESYSPKNVRVVGIVDTDYWLMTADLAYHRAYHFPPVDLALVFTKNRADQETYDRWAEKKLKGERAQLFAYHQIQKNTDEMFVTLYAILNVVIGILVAVITVMMGMLINIYQGQRTVEFGLLQAIGHSKRQLIRRSLTESALVVVIGWGLGVIVARGLLEVVRFVLMEPRAFALDVADRAALLYTVPLPFAILAVAVGSILRRFRTFDPVAVVERRLA